MKQITGQTMLYELMQGDYNTEAIAEVLSSIGMHCLTCPCALNEAVEDAAMVHGLEPDELVAKLNAAAFSK
ncbi:MAG: DUF1858 domain-containing protein [Clostridia bacterium]|nr:DUF1858 domain-containing protein [Clostridia bacterium]